MTPPEDSKSDHETVSLRGRSHLLLLIFALVPLAIAAVVGAMTIAGKLPIQFTVILSASLLCTLPLAFSAFDAMRGATLEIRDSGLFVRRISGGQTYAWADIDSIRMIGATGTLADNPFILADDRIGIALNVGDRTNAQSGYIPRSGGDDRTREIVLAAGERSQAADFARTVEKLRHAQRLARMAAQTAAADIDDASAGEMATAGTATPAATSRRWQNRLQHRGDGAPRRPAKTKSMKDVIGQFRSA